MHGGKGLAALLLIGLLICLAGCGKKEETARTYENASDIDYEIVSGSDVPYKVNEKIYRAKDKSFGFSYRDGEEMYIAFGFGEQSTGGYSIQILAAKETETAILIEARLVAPGPEEVVAASPSQPYMILKTANVEKDIQFLLH